MRLNNVKNNGFSLAELLAALAIASMIMITAAAMYATVRRAQGTIETRLKDGFLAAEVIQRISEDIDRMAMPGSDVSISIRNKIDIENFKISQMIIESKIYDKDNKPMTFEKIVWQSRVASDGNGLIVYRAHSGYAVEDKMLEQPKENFEREMYIPVCYGATFFAIEVSDGNTVSEEWLNPALPQGVKISISFEPRQPDAFGGLTVAEESVKSRIIALNRFRQIPYTFVYKEFGDANDIKDMNDVNDVNQPRDINQPQNANTSGRQTEFDEDGRQRRQVSE